MSSPEWSNGAPPLHHAILLPWGSFAVSKAAQSVYKLTSLAEGTITKDFAQLTHKPETKGPVVNALLLSPRELLSVVEPYPLHKISIDSETAEAAGNKRGIDIAFSLPPLEDEDTYDRDTSCEIGDAAAEIIDAALPQWHTAERDRKLRQRVSLSNFLGVAAGTMFMGNEILNATDISSNQALAALAVGGICSTFSALHVVGYTRDNRKNTGINNIRLSQIARDIGDSIHTAYSQENFLEETANWPVHDIKPAQP